MSRLILVLALQVCLARGAVAQTPVIVTWQAPPGKNGFNWDPHAYPSFTCVSATRFDCFVKAVLPNISGIGIVVPWGLIDTCAANGTTSNLPCYPDNLCDPLVTKNCYNWAWIDQAINDYFHATVGTSSTFFNGCAGGKPCKIVLLVWLTQDSGNVNTYGGTPNTPLYVFTKDYANSLNSGAGCGPMCSQDVMVCIDRTGGPPGSGWSGQPQLTDDLWPNSGAEDFGLWNAYGSHILQNHSHHLVVNSGPTANFSGYPVMYEQPIQTAARAFISALALHYSEACTFPGCTTTSLSDGAISGAAIAPSIAYMRIGPSSGDENYPYCACVSSTGGSQCDTFYWPGPKGDNNGESQGYSDQGYLTAWPPLSGDGDGYVKSLYRYIHSLNWAFPVTTPAHEGPASNENIWYSDTEALLATQYGLGMGMQAASIGDSVTYATQHLPSSTANWAVHFREFPNIPVHHLETMNPGNPIQAARFTITGISSSGTGSATVTCDDDCNNFCIDPPWVYISGVANPAFDGIQKVNTATCTAGQLVLSGQFPSISSLLPPGPWGYVFSGAHLPILLPFVMQQCQGSLQTICSVEVWNELLDWAYGTNTVSNTTGNTSSGDMTYQSAINNFLVGLPSATSTHNHMSTHNAKHY